MAVDTEVRSDGRTTYVVRVVRRSKVFPDVRLQLRERGFPTREKAEAAEIRLARQAERRVWERDQQGLSVQTVLRSWALALRESSGLLEASVRATEMDTVTEVTALLGPTGMRDPISKITRAFVLDRVHALLKLKMSRSRVRKYVTAFRRLFKWAQARRLFGVEVEDPTDALGVQWTDRVVERGVLNPEQMATLIERAQAVGHPWAPVWAVACLTGMRSGELQALKWKDVDLDGARLHVRCSHNSRLQYEKTPKNGRARTVPINEDLRTVLVGLRETPGRAEYVLPRIASWRRGESAWPLRAFLKECGLPTARFHDLRASFATALLAQGVSAVQVQKICGWSDVKTMERYIRMAGVDVANATDSLRIINPMPDSGRVVPLRGAREGLPPASLSST